MLLFRVGSRASSDPSGGDWGVLYDLGDHFRRVAACAECVPQREVDAVKTEWDCALSQISPIDINGAS